MKILDNARQFKHYPNSLKNGIMLLFAAWIWFLMVLYLINFDGYLLRRLFVGGFIACTCIFTLNKWARTLVILANIFAILQILPTSYSLLQAGKVQSGLYLGIAGLLFASSAFFLFIKPTAEYFQKIHDEEKKEQKINSEGK
ncbi:MAG: hypothetical protein ACOC23_02080 [Thermodesulfobacteriota bacterium]